MKHTIPYAVILAGCGYTVGVDEFGSSRSVAVEVADNRSYRQGIVAPLTREIHAQLAEHTDMRQTSSDRADAVLRVTITEVEGQPIVRSGDPPLREGALDFTVEVELVDRVTGRPLRQRQVLDRAEYRTAIGESLETATAEAISDIARKIVLALEGDF